MARLDPRKIVEKQLERVRESVDYYKEGVQNPERNPIEAALQAQKKWANKLMEAIKNGTWTQALSSTSFDDWQRPTVEVGPRHWLDNIEAKSYKIERFWQNWAPLLEAHKQKIRAMKDETDADREARMLANLRGLKQLKGQWRKK